MMLWAKNNNLCAWPQMYSVVSLQFKTTVFYVNVFERFYKKSNFFDQKYSENNNIVKYYYNLD